MNQPNQDHVSDACDRRLIHRFLESENYGVEDEELVSHLDSCPTCREYLETEAGAAEVWQNATELLKPDEFDLAGTAHFSAATMCGESVKASAAAHDVLESLTPSEDPNHLGRLGTYEVTGVVGVGGMGVVLKAIDPSLDRVVAVKVMAPRLANNEKARQRFAREAKAAAAVLHPNVIPIHSVSSDSSVPYLVMAYVRGGSLQKRIELEGALPVVEILRIGSQIAEGLAAAHDQGLVHRDIKPENVLLEEGVERVAITDFGLARAVDDNTVTQQGTIAGTPMYMSPEQARGDQVDQRSDLFSLGSVLYALCTGRPPFRGDSSFGVMRQIIDEQPTPLLDLNPEIPDWLSGIVEKLMSKEKSDRFDSAADVHELLERCLSHTQQPSMIELPQIPGPKRPRRPFLKTGKGVFTMASLAVVSFMLLPMMVSLLPQAPPQRQTAAENILEEITVDAEFPVREVNEDLAERLVGRKDHLTFTRLKTLTPAVAAILATHPANLSFPAIEQLSPEVAKALASKDSLWLQLDGLQEISPDVARALGSAKCALSLRGVSELTPELAENLIQQDQTRAFGLTSISTAVATVLARHKGWLSLNYLRSLDPESAAALVAHKNWISLDGLNWLSPDLAKALGNFDGDKLDLNGLTSLDAETADLLAQARCRSGLYLNGLKTITAETLDALANGNSGLSFQGLQQIDVETKQALEAVGEKLENDRKFLVVRDPRFVKVWAANSQMDQITELLEQWKRTPDPSAKSDVFAKQISKLYDELIKQTKPSTENRRRTLERLALLAWSHLAGEIPQSMAATLVDLTEPYPAIRALDRQAQQDRPTEALGWDVQAAHAVALARAGKTEEALKENQALMKKVEVNLLRGRLPDVRFEFFGGQRSTKSLLKQTLLQKSLILAIAGKSADAAEASATAGQVEQRNPTEDDHAAIQALLQVLATDGKDDGKADEALDVSTRMLIDQGYTVFDNGKSTGSRRLIVTEKGQTLSIVEELSLALKFQGAPLGIVQRDFQADYSLSGNLPVFVRGLSASKEQGSMIMEGTVAINNGEALTRWTRYTQHGRKLETPKRHQATVKPPQGTLVFGSSIQVVGPLFLLEDGEREVVWGHFDMTPREGQQAIEYEAGCKLRRTARPDGSGFTITLTMPNSKSPELTIEYDNNSKCKSLQWAGGITMKPR